MKPRDYLKQWVADAGGCPAAAARLKVPYSTLAAILNGYRGISPRMAERMHKADPTIDRNVIVWVRPQSSATKKAA
jgi:plasmid maintenance system antidote protein VapI